MDVTALRQQAQEIRADIIDMIAQAGSGHPGGSLSSVEILSALYLGGILDHHPADAGVPRDRFILSKGHAAPVLYATLAQAGYLPREELATLRQYGSRLQGHPSRLELPSCVEVSTGSLGQGLSVGAGLALGLRDNGEDSQVFVLLGDGEMQEGQVWEALLFAAHHHLGNLVAILDHNTLQIDGPNDEVESLGDIRAKAEAFGWRYLECDGHDLAELLSVLGQAKAYADGPVFVRARTVKGKGVSFMEGQAGWHGKAPDAAQTEQALAEIKGA